MPATTNIIDELGTSWKLTVQEFAVYSYDHPAFGYLEYVGRSPWLCDNVNTVWLRQQGSLPDNILPPSICIRPKYYSECGGGCYDLNGYTPPSAKALCKDHECDFDLPLYLTCLGVTQSCIGHFVKTPGEPTECPNAGVVYVAQCTLNSVVMRVRIYCDGTGQWMADVLNDGVVCDSCIPLSPTFCPLVMGGGTATPCANNCVPCIGPDCGPPPTPVCGICSVVPPAVLTLTLSSPIDCPALDGDSFPIVYTTGLPDIDGNTAAWIGTDTCGNTWRMWCGDTWPDWKGYTWFDDIADRTVANGTITEGDCSPFEANTSSAVSATSTPCCGTASVYGVVTE